VTVTASTKSTREKLLDTATMLYAERGVFNVSLSEIVREAGQRNASAVHYYFGSRDQMLLAILEPNVEILRTRRLELLARAAANGDDDVRPVVEAIVRPLTELARRGWRERAWMKIGMEIADYFDRVAPEVRDLLDQTGGTEALAALEVRVPTLPPEIWMLRRTMCIGFVSRAATDRARSLGDTGKSGIDDELFVSNLVDMVIGALTAPLTPPRQ
jgi:AcrR family transcriptional regulator